MGDVHAPGRSEVLVRVHSECLTGDVVGSLRCDCGSQFDQALRAIAAEGCGVIVYLRGHEGRGVVWVISCVPTPSRRVAATPSMPIPILDCLSTRAVSGGRGDPH